MFEPDSERTSERSVCFKSPFRLSGDDDFLPPGEYEVQTTEAVYQVRERTVSRRISTVLIVQTLGKRRFCEIDPVALEEALKRDGVEISGDGKPSVTLGSVGEQIQGDLAMSIPSGSAETEKSALMAEYGITEVPVHQYHYRDWRYSTLADALAQARRDAASSFK